jgi:hypothetical protein
MIKTFFCTRQDSQVNNRFIEGVNLEYKPVNFNNIDVMTSGTLFETFNTAEVNVNNVTFDFHKASGSITITTF